VAFVVEDGTGLPNANAYCSVAFADAYMADRGRTDWAAATNDARQIAIIKATDFIDHNYKFVGVRETSTQALEWPRTCVYDELGEPVETIPKEILEATAEYARIALTLEITAFPTSELTGTVLAKREKVGPIEEETRFASASNVIRRYRLADAILSRWTVSGNFLLRV